MPICCESKRFCGCQISVFLTDLSQNLWDILSSCLRLIQKSAGGKKTDPKRDLSAANQWRHSVQCVAGDYNEEEKKEENETRTFPWGSFSTQHSNQGKDGGWGGSRVRKQEEERENRPNWGKGWAQQPEADCRGQLHKITSEREKQGSAETERMEAEAAID